MTHPFPAFHQEGPVSPEELYPDSDVAVSGWEEDDDSTTTLYTAVATQSNADYVRPQVPGLEECPTTENDSIEFGLENPTTDPVGGVDSVSLRVTMRYNMLVGGTGSATARFRLREGTTVRATRSGITLTTSFVQYSLALTTSEVNAIGDWTNLRCLCDADVCVDSVGDEISFEISQIVLDIN